MKFRLDQIENENKVLKDERLTIVNHMQKLEDKNKSQEKIIQYINMQ